MNKMTPSGGVVDYILFSRTTDYYICPIEFDLKARKLHLATD